jgi:hypothetical protein
MRIGAVSHSLLMLIAGGTASLILAAGSARAAPRAQADLVEFEKMTWVEVKSALAAGKTTALYTGGVEERGPQDANGGHNLMAHATVEAIARELGNAIFMPVLPYTPNDAESIPGTIGITNELLAAMLATNRLGGRDESEAGGAAATASIQPTPVTEQAEMLSNSSRSRDSEDLRHKRRVNDHVWRDGVVAECMHPCIARTQR